MVASAPYTKVEIIYEAMLVFVFRFVVPIAVLLAV
jgi:hypothetical protein